MPCRRRIAKATGGQVVMALADMDGNESFEASSLGTAEEVRRRSRFLTYWARLTKAAQFGSVS